MVQRARIRLLSTSVDSLRGITDELTNISEKFGCDLLRYSSNAKTIKKLSLYKLRSNSGRCHKHHNNY